MIRTIGDPRDNVAAFLRRAGVTIDRLTEIAGTEVYAPRHVVATGSVAAGYGNERSDIDLLVVTDDEVPFGQSIAHELATLVDINTMTRKQLDRRVSLIDEWRQRTLSVDPMSVLLERRTTHNQLARLVIGAPVIVDEQIAATLVDLGGSALINSCVVYWRERQWRRLVALDLLPPGSPAAVESAVDAAVAALKADLTELGYLYVNTKFLGLEVLDADRSDFAERHERIRRAGSLDDLAGRPDWVDRARRWAVGEIEHPPDAEIGITWSPGVELRPLGGQTVVSLWDRQGCIVNGRLGSIDEFIWTGPLGERPDPSVSELLQRGLVQIEVVGV